VVGGTIIGLAHRQDGTTLVHVADCPHYPKHGRAGAKKGRGLACPSPDTCSVVCRARHRTEMDIGDQVWWQCGKVYWTPREPSSVFVGGQHLTSEPGGRRQGIDFDIELEKVGYSH
jgi:hypothetical protein